MTPTMKELDKQEPDDGGLSDIFPEPGTVRIDGEPIEITPLMVKQIGAFSRAIRPLAGDISRLFSKPEQADNQETTDFILRMVASHADEVIEAVAIATGKPAAWVGDLMPDDLCFLVLKIIEVNADFFASRLAPGLEMVMKETGKSIGSIASRRSGKTDT
jgi:Family of unknown function (DUF6631)